MSTQRAKSVFFSIVIPTYNRLPILQKCLRALEIQTLDEKIVTGYEVVVVDDGSTDGTIEWLQNSTNELPHLKIYEQAHKGASAARNMGVERATGDTIVFIDSDIVVTPTFLQCHADVLLAKQAELGNDRVFTYGAVINTANFESPTSEPYKLLDFSNAYFATTNVAIAKHWLIEVGLFDLDFDLYGWEDLELGVRLKNQGIQMVKCPEAVGYHWHPAFSLDRIPRSIEQELERGKMGVIFYKKHPTMDVKIMIQMTVFHRILWNILSLGGLLNERTMKPLLQWSIDRGNPQLAEQFARIFLNQYSVQEVHRAYQASLRASE
ncbi:glycosyltransferase family 2 protein [Chamaesiphon minutus]|uniref:Putative glycosyltransferase n=1 Tax=Chamaesiphon minutus (strain ATCC 27169 / PCC 6605) TaxID=1173020 RepID=K9UH61_CHAP6|nr:glycosyltransferase [Chamaesiphon minutus]AFY94442.1 putative glycosyltransferase [Chamaesiphon minutus PCC 6605]